MLLLFFWDDSVEDTYVFSLPSIEKEQLHLAVGQRIDEYLKTIEATDGSANAWGNLGTVLDLHDLKTAAIVCYRHAIELDDKNFRWPYFAGICATIFRSRFSSIVILSCPYRYLSGQFDAENIFFLFDLVS